MAQKITLPVSGLEVELAVFTWAEAKEFFGKAAEHMREGKPADDWMEEVLRKHYPKKTLAVVLKAAPDAMALYNDTVRYNKMGPEAVKNSLRSGPGDQTRTE